MFNGALGAEAKQRALRMKFRVVFAGLCALSLVACETSAVPSLLFSHPMEKKRVTSSFGPRGNNFHQGVDYGAPTGTRVRAAGPGRVVFVGTKNGYGKLIIINHGADYETYYAHLSKIYVNNNQLIVGGLPIGAVGTTGRTTGPHLHFETRRKGMPINPMILFR